jgi:hypothetical protein
VKKLRPRHAAFCLGLLTILSGATSNAKDVGGPALWGTANTIPPGWEHKPVQGVAVTFCAYGAALPKGATVTVVPKSGLLRSVVAKVAKVNKRLKDGCLVEVTEPIREDAWLKGEFKKGGAWEYPRVLVLAGSWIAAHPVDPKGLQPDQLPPETAQDDVLLAAAAFIGRQPQVVARSVCEDGSRNCQEFGCVEVLRSTKDGWKRDSRQCGED